MSLIQNLIDEAQDDSTSVSSLLRKAKVLAYKLKNDPLLSWINHELDGYAEREKVPSYRVLRPINTGFFSGPFGSGIKNARIPMELVPDYAKERFAMYYAMQCKVLNSTRVTLRASKVAH